MRSLRPRRVACALTCGLLIAGGGAAWAAHEGERVLEVDVAGTKTVAAPTILAKVQTKPGALYAEQVISEDIRRIFALGYFTDVRADVAPLSDGLRLTFVVTEKPTVGTVRLEGNRTIPKPKLLEVAGLKTGELYDPRKLKQAADLMKAEYVRRGFSSCEVVSNVEVDERANTATVSLLVDEGPRTRLAGILVEGNQAFSDSRIRKILKTKRRSWFFFSGVYSEQVLEEDLERVKAFYRLNGYQDIQATQDVYRDPQGRGLLVHLKLAEGLQHRVGQVAIEGTKLFPERDIRQAITLKPGDVYSDQALQDDLRQIKQYYGDRGYINADIAPHPQLDPATKRVDLTYHITENELVYINRIDIRGNLHTQDIVVRRDLRILPGEAFDGTRIRTSIERLQNLGFFEEVNVETEPTSTENKEDLIIQVKEAKTGSFSFGGGFSSVDRLVGLVELEQRNFDWKNFPSFTGAGQDVRFRVEAGTVRRFFDISFTEPWIFGHPVSFGIDVYNRTRLRSGSLGVGYEEERRGGGVRLGREFADVVQTGINYQAYRTEISDVAPEASADLRAEAGRNTISVAGVSAALDRRNNRFDPTDGGYVFASADLAGGLLAGDKDFYRLQAGASYYFPHGERYVLESRVRTGIVDGYGDTSEVPIFERFFGGGTSTVRGFRERRIGPVDPSSNDPIGGESTFVATIEEVMTIVKDERGRAILKGSGFFDIGDVWRRVADYGESLKAGTGIGARVNTPIGPLRLDLGFPLSDVADEPRKPRFHFNISRSF